MDRAAPRTASVASDSKYSGNCSGIGIPFSIVANKTPICACSYIRRH